jgi:hypothetical protein
MGVAVSQSGYPPTPTGGSFSRLRLLPSILAEPDSRPGPDRTIVCTQGLIDNLTYNTEFFSEHAINSASWLADCPGGTKLYYSPDTDLAREIARDAMRRLMCDAHVCATDASQADLPPPSMPPDEEQAMAEKQSADPDAPRRSTARSSSGTTFMQVTTGVCSVLDSQLEQLQGVMDQAVSTGATYLVNMYNWADDPFQNYINAFCLVCNGEPSDNTNATLCDGWLDQLVQVRHSYS